MNRWYVLVLALLLVGVGSYLGAAHVSGGALPVAGLPLGGDRGELRRRSLSFLEDLRFKDFEAAAAYHAPEDLAAVDIPYLIERTFVLKPEALDLMTYEVVSAEIDSTGDRARVKVRVTLKDLVRGKPREQDVILYWHRAAPDAPWFMQLESSLRKGQAEPGKKH